QSPRSCCRSHRTRNLRPLSRALRLSFSAILSMHETCKPPLTPPQHMMQRTPSKSRRYNQGDIAMNASHSSMRSVASTLVATAVLLLVSCSLGTHGPAGGFVLAAGPKGQQTHTVVIRELKFQPAVLTVKVGDKVEWKNDDIVPHTATSTKAMTNMFRRVDRVEWKSEAGRVRGVIIKRVVSYIRIKGYVHHASKEEPQYLIQSDKTDHVAIHKGKALRHIRAKAKKKSRKQK